MLPDRLFLFLNELLRDVLYHRDRLNQFWGLQIDRITIGKITTTSRMVHVPAMRVGRFLDRELLFVDVVLPEGHRSLDRHLRLKLDFRQRLSSLSHEAA